MGKKWLLLVFSLFWLADTVFTLMFVGALGLEAEANPLVRGLMQRFGPMGLITFKVAAIIPLVAIHRHVPTWVYSALILIMLPVVYFGGKMAFGWV